MRKSILFGVGLIAIMLAIIPMASAAKGGSKGKPGGDDGGGGGSTLPAAELVFLARHKGTNGYNSYELYKATANQSQMSRLTNTLQFSGEGLAVDGGGEVALLGTSAAAKSGLFVTDLDVADSYTEVVPPLSSTDPDADSNLWMKGWSRRRDSNTGALLPYSQQAMLVTKEHKHGAPRPDQPDEDHYHTENVVLVAADGTGTEHVLTSMTNTWDEDTRLYVHESARVLGMIPSQTGNPNRSWILYHTRVLTVTFDENNELQPWDEDDEEVDHRVMTVDLSNWPNTVTTVDDRSITLPWSEDVWGRAQGAWGDLVPPPAFSPDGRFALINREGSAYVVPVQFDMSTSTISVPDPTSDDEIAVTVPDGYEPGIQVRDVSDDASLIALNLFKKQKSGKGKWATETLVRHLFVGRLSAIGVVTDLTQIDVGTDGVEFEYATGSDSFLAVRFLPGGSGN